MSSISFKKGSGQYQLPRNSAILGLDNWDDYSFKTLFSLYLIDEFGVHHKLGNLKIGFVGQTESRTSDFLPPTFENLPESYFSLGQDADYYKRVQQLSEITRNSLMQALRDVIYTPQLLRSVETEKVFTTSLTRSISKSVMHGQFKRILSGGALLTKFHFTYKHDGGPRTSAHNLAFEVNPESTPSTNIHVLIGRNGVGKTTLLNNMVSAIVSGNALPDQFGQFWERGYFEESPLAADYFGGVVSVSFSAFDPFVPLPEQSDRDKGLTNFYIGLKKIDTTQEGRKAIPKTNDDLRLDFITSLEACYATEAKRVRWVRVIKKLESDENFATMDLADLAHAEDVVASMAEASRLFGLMSSGHAVVLLCVTKLVETVEEKTLVLLDEPESHLHPPLLSAFIRAMSDLLNDRNGVAIIATHSPVVVQEVPKSCVWKLHRVRTQGMAYRPEEETFGENVGTLTREIFGLEVSKSGFHDVLSRAVSEGKLFEQIFDEYNGQLGFEAQALLRALIAARKRDLEDKL